MNASLNSVGPMVLLKQEGQMSKLGHWGRVSQSFLPLVKVARGHDVRGAALPLSTSSEKRR